MKGAATICMVLAGLLTAFCAHAAGEGAGTADLLELEAGDFPRPARYVPGEGSGIGHRAGNVKIQREHRPVVWRFAETKVGPVAVDAHNRLTLEVGEHFNWGDGDKGIHVRVMPIAPASDMDRKYKPQYRYVARENFFDGRADVKIEEVSPPVGEAIVKIRCVPSVVRSWTSAPVLIPEDASLQAAYGVLRDWPAMRPSTFQMSVSVVAEADHEVVIGRYSCDPRDERRGRWRDVQLDLEAYAGQQVRFVFRAMPDQPDARLDSVQAYWATPRLVVGPETKPVRRPNVLLISLDTLRADRTTMLGYARDTSPQLASFAADAAVFTEAISPSTWTTPSHASIFTGALPWEHGAGSWARGYRLDREWVTIAELARDAGYVTAAYTEGGAVGGDWGFDQGFSVYSDGRPAQRDPGGIVCDTLEDAWNWMAKRSAAPFFLFLHTFEIHSPYCSPEPSGTRYVEDVEGGSNCIEERDITDASVGARASDLYDGGVQYTDAVVGHFLERMREVGLLENTVVIILSDHGEELGEHGAYGHTSHIFREVIHVPLVIRLPNGEAEGRRISRLVSTRDVHATIAELMGVDRGEAFGATHSLLPLVRGESPDDYPRKKVFSHLPLRNSEVVKASGRKCEFDYYSVQSAAGRFMIDNEPWVRKSVGLDAGEEVVPEWRERAYDYAESRSESVAVAVSEHADLSRLKDALYDRLRQEGQLRHTLDEAKGRKRGVSEEAAEQMEALGYF